MDLLRRIAQQGKVDQSKTQKAIDGLSREINDINDLTGDRLRNAADQITALTNLTKARDAFSGIADFETSDAQFNLKMGISSSAQVTGDQVEATINQIIDKDLALVSSLQALQLQTSEFVGLLREIAQVDTRRASSSSRPSSTPTSSA